MCILGYSKLSNELKDGIEILVGQAFFKLRIKTVKLLFGSLTQALFKLWIQTVKLLFGSITQKPLGLPLF